MRLRPAMCVLACCSLVALFASSAAAAIRMPAIFTDNMLLQRDQPVPVWGWAARGEKVTVSVAGQTVTTKAGDDGRWRLTLGKLDLQRLEVQDKIAEGKTQTTFITIPLTMTVQGSGGNLLTFKNVVVGDVWVCSGQSNMELGLNQVNRAKEEIAAANYADIRLFDVVKQKAPQPVADLTATWTTCRPETAANFSAVAYFFGRQLHKNLDVPVGLIGTYWGGTPAEFWTSAPTLAADPALKPLAQGEAACLYNAMIAPLVPYAIRGAIWYQGESNISRSYQYRTLLPAMIANWRSAWGQGNFPFGIVQIAPFRYGGSNPVFCAEMWEAQSMIAQTTPNTGLAVTMDIGDLRNIHPTNKQDVGRRLALWAEATVYGRKQVYSGPIYKSMVVEGEKIRLNFDHVGGGLIAADGKPLTEFTIAGADQKFVPATATIDDHTLVVHADQVTKPVAVRYAWHDDAQPNFANKEGLPASPFRTDAWKGVTQ
ncbi:MAG: sialate O-acetylesterase [Thermoguttaceae bacterium]